MIRARLRFALLCLLPLVTFQFAGQAAVIYTYDFPGSPGTGLGGSQSNGQPTGATFGDFTRTGGPTADTTSNAFGSKNWSLSGSIDTTQYTSFTITADAGLHLNLGSISFDTGRSASGPTSSEVALYINGVFYDKLDYSTAGSIVSLKPTTWDFTDLTDANNATTATFYFYNWNASGVAGQFIFDNVATDGVITNAPEAKSIGPILILVGCILVETARRRQTRRA